MLRMSKITSDGLTRSGWHRMLHSSTHMATVGDRGLTPSHRMILYSIYSWCVACAGERDDVKDHYNVSWNRLFLARQLSHAGRY